MFLAFNRREELRLSLRKTVEESSYPSERLELIVVDNASTDGTGEMLASEFPSVKVVSRSENVGVSAWNDGFALATGDYVLALDDDCYLPASGLERAIQAAQAERADLVSFGVTSSFDRDFRFDRHDYLTGLLSFWGCAVLMRREVLERLHGFDPQIFLYAHELEFMLRFYDEGFRHLHLPEVVAVHMKAPTITPGELNQGPYRLNYRNWGYIAAKQLAPRDAGEALLALLAQTYREGRRIDSMAYKAAGDTLRGFLAGLRRRSPVRASVSRVYRRNFETFASPWWFSRTPRELAHDLLVQRGQTGHANRNRRDEWFAERACYFPEESAVLEL